MDIAAFPKRFLGFSFIAWAFSMYHIALLTTHRDNTSLYCIGPKVFGGAFYMGGDCTAGEVDTGMTLCIRSVYRSVLAIAMKSGCPKINLL